jgi:hypothetical protein
MGATSFLAKLAQHGGAIVLIGALISAFGAYLQVRQNRALNAELRTKSAEIIDYAKGVGSYFYLDVTAVPGTAFALAVPHYVGTNPVYEATMNIVDSQAGRKPQVVALGTLTKSNGGAGGAYQLKMEFGDTRGLHDLSFLKKCRAQARYPHASNWRPRFRCHTGH